VNANCVKFDANNFAYYQYERFSVWLSCTQKTAVLSMAVIGVNKGSENTKSRNYFLDDSAKGISCQKTSDETYASYKEGFDAGHLNAIDHFDENEPQALQTNTMANMVPQATSFYRNGAWKKTESLTECYRYELELSPLTAYSVVLYGNDQSNDCYSECHGLPETPDHLWKLIYTLSANQYDLWIMKNSNTSNVSTLPNSRRSITSLITMLDEENELHYIPVIAELLKIRVKTQSKLS
jgi:endonuclease G